LRLAAGVDAGGREPGVIEAGGQLGVVLPTQEE